MAGIRGGQGAALLVAGVLVLGAVSAPAFGGTVAGTAPQSVATASGEHAGSADRTHPAVRTTAQVRRILVRMTNRARARHDLRPLQIRPCLAGVAQHWAAHMARRGQLEHNDLGDVQQACNAQVPVGENIAMGYRTPRAVLRAWMHSEGHRANILRRSYDHIGVGVRRDSDGRRWWVQDFADFR